MKYEDDEEKRIQKVDDEKSGDLFNTVIIIIAIIVIIIAIFVMIKVFKGTSSTDEDKSANNNVTQTDNQNNTSNSDSNNNVNDSSELGISSINENYNAYPIEIESVVHVKGGNFYGKRKNQGRDGRKRTLSLFGG